MAATDRHETWARPDPPALAFGLTRGILRGMLLELSIRDLALIDALEVRFGPGFNVLTGETGAGKSLLVGSLELLRGETPRGGAAQWVRNGAEEARVEGRFVVRGPQALRALAQALESELPDIAADWADAHSGDEAELILGRSLSKSGRTRAHVEQRPVPLRALKALAPFLIEIHGQNDHQRLLDPVEQTRLLDAYGGLDEALAGYRDARATWIERAERFRLLSQAGAERRDRTDLLRFQLGELRGAELDPGERLSLVEERELLRGAQELRRVVGAWVHAFLEADDSTVGQLRSAEKALEAWSAKLPRLGAPLEDLANAQIHLQEAAGALSSLLEDVRDDPARLEAVEDRLAELERLEHKYRAKDEGLLALIDEFQKELDELENSEESLATLEGEIATALGEVEARAAELTQKRRALGEELTPRLERTLKNLGLERARFGLALGARQGGPEERFGPRGSDDLEFLLAANPGEEPRPLRHVASGGEAARIMLALRTVLQGAESGRSLVFDEIDAGVGGRLGPEVAQHLRELARNHQVLCVTHLPAIAAQAHLHLHTHKEVQAGRTRSRVRPLEGEARVAEIADMIAGGAEQATARAEAVRLIGLGGESEAPGGSKRRSSTARTPAKRSAKKPGPKRKARTKPREG